MGATAGGQVNVSIGAVFASGFKTAFTSAEGQINKLGGTVRSLDSRLSQVTGFRKLRDDTYNAETAWRAADRELREMSAHLAGLNTITDKQAREFRELEKRTMSLKRTFENGQRATDAMQQELREAGISTNNLADEQRGLQRQLDITTARMKAMAGLANTGLGAAVAGAGMQFRTLATQATFAGAGIGYFFKRNFVDTAAQFEKFRTILETTEGSAAKAEKAMSWISDFAAKTPYELENVTDAFVKLRAYGLDPTNGLLKTLGDTSAAMGKDVMQAVEAIADAVTGENERLKEFGVRGSKKGGMVTYEYTDRAGQQQSKTIDANNRKLIESTLVAIFNEKYAGQMDKLSKTWGGMTSNIGDQWTRFTNMVMASGPFEIMKEQLAGVLSEIDKMSADGRLKAYAEQTGAALIEFGKGAFELGKALYGATAAVADFVGGWKNLGLILAAVKLAPLAFSIGKVGWALAKGATFLMMFVTGSATAGAAWLAFASVIGKGALMAMGAFKALAAFMLTNPIGLALTALGVAAYLLWQNWDTVKSGLVALWQTIQTAAVGAFDAIKSSVGAVIDWLAEKTAWIFATVDKLKSAASSVGDRLGSAWQGAKNFIGVGDSPSSGTAAGAMTAPAAVVPAAPGGGTVSSSTTVNAPITINGATDPRETAKQVREELNRRERDAAAGRRSQLTDQLGY